MHSSRMRTAHLLTVSCSIRWGGGAGVSAWGCLPGGCLPRGCLPRGCLPSGRLPRGCRVCLGGLSAKGGVCQGGVCIAACSGANMNHRQV